MTTEVKKAVDNLTLGHHANNTSSTSAGTTTTGVPKLTLYTAHQCPWAHRAHIAITALGLPYDEVLIDLGKPREPWYLKDVNPRGLVPSLKIESSNGTQYILTESLIVTHFLVDLAHSLPEPYSTRALGFNPPPTSLERSLRRAAANFFVDAYFTKVHPLIGKFAYPSSPFASDSTSTEAEEKAGSIIEAIRKEIEPLLVDAKPFFGGSSHPTIVEALIGSFILRLYGNLEGGFFFPSSFTKGIQEVTPRFWAWSQAVKGNEIVQAKIWDSERHITGQKARIEKAAADAAAAASTSTTTA